LAYIDFYVKGYCSWRIGRLLLKKLHGSLLKGDLKAKKGKQRKLTSEEFLRLYEVLWEKGPKVEYLNPEKTSRGSV